MTNGGEGKEEKEEEDVMGSYSSPYEKYILLDILTKYLGENYLRCIVIVVSYLYPNMILCKHTLGSANMH